MQIDYMLFILIYVLNLSLLKYPNPHDFKSWWNAVKLYPQQLKKYVKNIAHIVI